MSQLRKPVRIVILASAFITLAYLGLNETNSGIAAWLVIIGSVGITSAWATIWNE